MRLINTSELPQRRAIETVMEVVAVYKGRWLLLDVALLSAMVYNWPVRLMDLLR